MRKTGNCEFVFIEFVRGYFCFPVTHVLRGVPSLEEEMHKSFDGETKLVIHR